ncbi:hypothetical protein CDAR_104251 [Caerostris darwini]|uniref:Uncharacterized protein n=1 Tax=Caerostris darwini TaxID=1538125 RepID=A0AAV4PT13_9ARAC|nr:hypothetical protein CDAR_104251 [Caerostris darwini]
MTATRNDQLFLLFFSDKKEDGTSEMAFVETFFFLLPSWRPLIVPVGSHEEWRATQSGLEMFPIKVGESLSWSFLWPVSSSNVLSSDLDCDKKMTSFFSFFFSDKEEILGRPKWPWWKLSSSVLASLNRLRRKQMKNGG